MTIPKRKTLRRQSTRAAAVARERAARRCRSVATSCPRCHLAAAVDLHELARRSSSRSAALDVFIQVELCRTCHDWVGGNPAAAVADGWAMWGWQYRATLREASDLQESSIQTSDASDSVPGVTTTRSSRLRAEVAQRDGGVCVDCPPGTPPWPYDQWHADHIVPWSSGGPDELDNLATRCVEHHKAKTLTESERRRVHGKGVTRPGTGRRPGRPPSDRMPVTVKIAQPGILAIDRLAAEHGVDRSEMIRQMLKYAEQTMPRPRPVKPQPKGLTP